jgi:hypothetical protein
MNAKEYITFDPKLQEHLQAYYTLHYRGKQSNLRFRLEKPFTNVVAMMQHKICEMQLQQSIKGFALDLRY